jgi:hypothetical protein
MCAASALVLAGCPLPIARTETAAAPVVGRMVWADGTPASGVEVAVVTKYGDKPCTTPELHAQTDASGTFHFPIIEKHYSTTWFVPNLDRIAPRFRLCAAVRDTMRAAYRGSGSLYDGAPIDSVSCVVWEWQASPRVSCNGEVEHAIVTGGHWTEGNAEGVYRLFLTQELTHPKGYDKNYRDERPYVYVQWLEPTSRAGVDSSAQTYRVLSTISLPFDHNDAQAVQTMKIWRRNERWVASLEGMKHGFMNGASRSELVFELGPPGQATLIAGP